MEIYGICLGEGESSPNGIVSATFRLVNYDDNNNTNNDDDDDYYYLQLYIYNLQFSQIERTCVKVNGAPQ